MNIESVTNSIEHVGVKKSDKKKGFSERQRKIQRQRKRDLYLKIAALDGNEASFWHLRL